MSVSQELESVRDSIVKFFESFGCEGYDDRTIYMAKFEVIQRDILRRVQQLLQSSLPDSIPIVHASALAATKNLLSNLKKNLLELSVSDYEEFEEPDEDGIFSMLFFSIRGMNPDTDKYFAAIREEHGVNPNADMRVVLSFDQKLSSTVLDMFRAKPWPAQANKVLAMIRLHGDLLPNELTDHHHKRDLILPIYSPQLSQACDWIANAAEKTTLLYGVLEGKNIFYSRIH